MSEIQIATRDHRTTFQSGEAITGAVGWKLDHPPESVELRLFWRTEGAGTQDVGLADTVTFSEPDAEEARPFLILAPVEPVSFTGNLISLIWSLELVISPGNIVTRLDLVISPTGQKIALEEIRRKVAPKSPV